MTKVTSLRRRKQMKKNILIVISIMLVVLASTTIFSACANGTALAKESVEKSSVSEKKEGDLKSSVSGETAKEESEKDAIIGTFKYPDNPYGGDFDSYIVFDENGSFSYVTHLYKSEKGGDYTEQVRTNKDFYWIKTGNNSYELHEDYHDINGEFVTPITYNAEEDAIYMDGSLYASRYTTETANQHNHRV